MQQDADAVDIRCIQVAAEYQDIFKTITGVAYKEVPDSNLFDVSVLPSDADFKELSLKLGEAIRQKGARILYMPSMTSNHKLSGGKHWKNQK